MTYVNWWYQRLASGGFQNLWKKLKYNIHVKILIDGYNINMKEIIILVGN